MNGPGATPPQPSDGTRTGLRVLFVLLAVVSCGMLAWTPLLRVALLKRRNAADWVLCGASFVLTLTLLVLIGQEQNSGSPRSNALVIVLLAQAAAAAVYYWVTDVRHYRALDARTPPRPYGQQPFPYGVQQQQQQQQQQPPAPRADYNPYRDTPTPAPAAPAPAPEPTPVPGPSGPPAPRIEQVRAELDELSDYLRKEEGR
ncbi:hypothetical protein QMK19_14815 [Streptomyces sp. H10-C2]|uniref:hypothetical protein n=1 Tax=unclassified Streptomyces TaxID=2593676 RepID=UPI0024B92CD6|nr:MULTISPECIES: hypothetical protein [unclassified Streptomyces]MDJ0341326.1 hypothetical protein [Streptomyces sp. PH10-H1]MDJ0370921.1 hypothetical protein [Streptomyces sp. H10-C2]